MIDTDTIDSVICAELPPDPSSLPPQMQEQGKRLQKIVLTNMVHGPCGPAFPNSPCMKNGKCSKGFPKNFSSHTIINEEANHPVYRRRKPEYGGRVITIRRGGRDFVVDNSWIVPYNPYFLLRYNAHINVELCTSVAGVKYLLNYVHKGCDMTSARTVVEGEEKNEIEEYRALRSIGSSEATWHIFEFNISKNYPAVKPLRVHLEDHQTVVFDEGAEEYAATNPRDTELMAFFEHNEKMVNAGRIQDFHRYVDFPEQYIYVQKDRKWKERVNDTDTIGRIHSVSPASGDVFYLRMLLHHDHCRGKTSFAHLRTLPGEDHPEESYKEVCRHLGLLQDDQEWHQALTEASITMFCCGLREMYVTILMFCEPSNPCELFNNHWLEWVDDFNDRARKRGRILWNEQLPDEQLKTMVLVDIDRRLQSWERTLQHFGLPKPTADDLLLVNQEDDQLFLQALIREEMDFDWQEMRELAQTRRGQYTPEQLAIYNLVMDRVTTGQSLCLFISARGGCGKSFISNGIMAAVRSSQAGGCVALAMATTGIAATLLLLGRTYHSRMKAPLTPSPDGVLSINSQSVLADLIRRAKIILIDEVTMMDRFHLEMMDRTLRDIIAVDQPFGGKIIILSGDFRQTLPVVPGANRAGITDTCINRSSLWNHFTVMELKTNMRKTSTNGVPDADLEAYDQWTISIGDGTAPILEEENLIQLPEELCMEIDPQNPVIDMDRFCEEIFPRLEQNYNDQKFLEGRAILAPTNKKVDEINDLLTKKLPGTASTLLSADALTEEEDPFRFSVEYLNTLQPSGIPRHKLVLKPGQPLMLLRNLNPKQGLCNGTRLIFIRVIGNFVLECKIVGENNRKVLIPRITLRPKEGQFGFDWARRQFPGKILL